MLVAQYLTDGNELVVEPTGFGRRGPTPLRAKRERVLFLARHGPALGDVLAGLAHRLEWKQLSQPRVRETPAERRVVQHTVAARKGRVRLGRHERRSRHRLDAACDEQVAVSCDHRMRRTDDRR